MLDQDKDHDKLTRFAWFKSLLVKQKWQTSEEKESIGSIHEVTLEGIDWLESQMAGACLFLSQLLRLGLCVGVVVVLVLGIITHHPRLSLLTYHPRGLVTFRPLLLCLHRFCSNQHNYPLGLPNRLLARPSFAVDFSLRLDPRLVIVQQTTFGRYISVLHLPLRLLSLRRFHSGYHQVGGLSPFPVPQPPFSGP
jgi:hypothetical protein